MENLTAELISAIGTPRFNDSLLALASFGLKADASAMIVLSRIGPPRVLIDHLVPGERANFYGDYLAGVYRLSPFYRSAVEAHVPSVARIVSIAPDNFRASEYYRRYFGLIGVSDMIGILLRLNDIETIFISFSRNRGHDVFTVVDVKSLRERLPVFAAAVTRHTEIASPRGTSRPRTVAADPRRGRLTSREAQVVDLILEGHSTRSISGKLEISVETVRVHRKHIYEKLGVGSQGALFNWFLASIGRQA